MNYWVSVGGREVEVEVTGNEVTVSGVSSNAALERVPGTPLQILTWAGRTRTLTCESEGRGQWVVGVQGRTFELEVLDQRARHIRSLAEPAAGKAQGGLLKAPMPGLVVRIQVEPGQEVAAGTPLIVLEAMKMENQLKAPTAGVVSEIQVAAGVAVEKGQVLLRLEPVTPI